MRGRRTGLKRGVFWGRRRATISCRGPKLSTAPREATTRDAELQTGSRTGGSLLFHAGDAWTSADLPNAGARRIVPRGDPARKTRAALRNRWGGGLAGSRSLPLDVAARRCRFFPADCEDQNGVYSLPGCSVLANARRVLSERPPGIRRMAAPILGTHDSGRARLRAASQLRPLQSGQARPRDLSPCVAVLQLLRVGSSRRVRSRMGMPMPPS